MKISKIYSIVFLCVLASCGKTTPPPLNTVGPVEIYDEDEDLSATSQSPTSKDPVIKQIEQVWNYSVGEVTVPANSTIKDAVSAAYSDWNACYKFPHVGGPKLIGEMAADKMGYSYSSYDYDITFNLCDLDQLHLKYLPSSDNLFCYVLRNELSIQDAMIVHENRLCLKMQVYNPSDQSYTFAIDAGQMIEADANDVQNVVVVQRESRTISPRSIIQLIVPIFCASHYRSVPEGSTARITPYILKASKETLADQRRVWDLIESNDDPNSYVTFYAWKKGDITSSGQPSLVGYTFIRIPSIGVIGFSSKHGSLLDDDGLISDQTQNMPYATDSCKIKVSQQGMVAIERKLNALRVNVPKYRPGRYDCTSFVMDLADVAAIRYGKRILIQTPTDFLQGLKKNNNEEL